MSDPISPASPRLLSLDAYRGFVMLLMAAEMLEVPDVAKHFPDSSFWQCLKFHSEHVAWSGCSLHDMIQPSFSFMVGVALPFSLASRALKGQSLARQWGHALWRSLVLVLLGVFLRSISARLTNWTFEDTLSQIGLGYPFLFALGFATTRVRWIALTTLLTGYWLLFALYTIPHEWTAAAANVKASWSHNFTGFAAHWNLNANPAWAFDRWFLNLFPREKPFLGNSGGYCTLNFLPTLGTMLLGLIAGHWMKHRTAPAALITRLLYAGAACMLLGGLLDATGVCPSVKKIWSPAWTLLSGGRCFWLMAAFFGIIDLAGWRRWAFPLVVIGTNSIAMYVLVHTTEKFWSSALDTHLGKAPFGLLGETFRPMLHGAMVLMILWTILLWMHRRKLFLRV
jgi:predicted acyltransferase